MEKGVELHQLISGSIFETVPGAGHLVIEENPNLLLDYILSFLSIENT